MPKTFCIIDGHSQIYRCFHARMEDLTGPSGEPTKATFLFTKMLIKLVGEWKPDYLVVAVEGRKESCVRRKKFPDYKADRAPKPDDVWVQVKRIKEIIRALGVPILQMDGYEADDVIASLVAISGNLQTTIFTRDKDLMQLLDPAGRVQLYDLLDDVRITYENAAAKWGVPPECLRTLFALMGDSADNIPGVKGVGRETAVKLVQQFRTYKKLIEGLDTGVATAVSAARCKSVLEAFDSGQLAMARDLIRLEDRLLLSVKLDNFQFKGLDYDAARPIFQELGFKRWA